MRKFVFILRFIVENVSVSGDIYNDFDYAVKLSVHCCISALEGGHSLNEGEGGLQV